MNEYKECLYNYIMENKFRKLMGTREYTILNRSKIDAERALVDALTAEQIKLFDSYMEQETSVNFLELRYVFREALALGVRLSRM